eukprot:CAMPEP_0198334376 /NCGR_PEP_ID=MMETSP1450-20131203/19565_1 /TAXON_ID=753684 ORGANISM="Madagascaria erythrocladiodes, Strain CCMP3234" /NCGR_SAMPLE_ID=MMETSP1450 /ASSEMBLY_ACC=CAM_ASM_001115 /LENGTH=491 /DNA_ID=CAMNT_0044038961 /DNA_START=139 /DNA_END=1614 /DNA_ORIENTATION=-
MRQVSYSRLSPADAHEDEERQPLGQSAHAKPSSCGPVIGTTTGIAVAVLLTVLVCLSGGGAVHFDWRNPSSLLGGSSTSGGVPSETSPASGGGTETNQGKGDLNTALAGWEEDDDDVGEEIDDTPDDDKDGDEGSDEGGKTRPSLEEVEAARYIRRVCINKEMGAPVCPQLFVLGCKKCGTTTMWKYLSFHEDFVAPKFEDGSGYIKEVAYFLLKQKGDLAENAVEKYVKIFPTRERQGQFSMDATPTYMTSFRASKMMTGTGIAPTGSSARFMMVLRNPVDRAYSDLEWYHRRGEFNESTTFGAAIDYCLPILRTCREEANVARAKLKQPDWRFLPAFYCKWKYRSKLYPVSGSPYPCDIFLRGLYADQLQRWVMEGYNVKEEFCVFETEKFVHNPRRAFETGNAGKKCLEPAGVDLEKLEPSTDSGNAHAYAKVDVHFPNARGRLMAQLYSEGNKDFDTILSDSFGMSEEEIAPFKPFSRSLEGAGNAT